MIQEISLFSAFLIGIAGSLHCVGMCGGVVSALSFSIPQQTSATSYHIAYHSGRILSYSIAGAVTGALGQLFSHQMQQGINILQLISGIFILLLGLYIGNWWRVLTSLEQLGKKLWRYIAPVSKRFLPLKSPFYALPYGFIWGWLPCGLVYSTLSWSMASGSATQGALVMAFFGLGTLPALLALSNSNLFIKNLLTNHYIKQLVAVTLMVFGAYILSAALQNIV